MRGKNKDVIASKYARVFDKSNPNWSESREHNRFFLLTALSHLNIMLKAQGHLFLNDVYKYLNMPVSRAGQIVGWVCDPEKMSNGVEFIILDEAKDGSSMLLDFNVDGEILNMLPNEF